jgi:hypothetical protein
MFKENKKFAKEIWGVSTAKALVALKELTKKHCLSHPDCWPSIRNWFAIPG